MKIIMIGPKDPALIVTQNEIQSHPELNAEITIIPWSEYRDALMDVLTAETAPRQAVFVPGHVWIPELAAGGFLTALDSLVEKLPGDQWEAYQPDDIMERVAVESRFKDQQYMIPTFNDGQILFYRTDLVSLDDSNGPPNISPFELLDLAAIKNCPQGVYGVALKAHPSEILFDWMPFFLTAGGELIDSSQQPAFASDDGIRALEAYCRLRKYAPPDTHEYGNAEIAKVLMEGKAALVTTWGGQAAPIFLDDQNPFRDRYKPAVFPHPCGATWGVAIPANQPEERQIEALQVVLALNGPAQDLEVILKAGSPVRKSSYTEDAFSRFSWLRAQYKMLNRFSLLPLAPEIGKFLGPMTEAVYKAFTGEASPKEALVEAEKNIKALVSA